MQLTHEQVHTITESLKRQCNASHGFATEVEASHPGLAAQFRERADRAEALRVLLENAHVVDVTPFDYYEHNR